MAGGGATVQNILEHSRTFGCVCSANDGLKQREWGAAMEEATWYAGFLLQPRFLSSFQRRRRRRWMRRRARCIPRFSASISDRTTPRELHVSSRRGTTRRAGPAA